VHVDHAAACGRDNTEEYQQAAKRSGGGSRYGDRPKMRHQVPPRFDLLS